MSIFSLLFESAWQTIAILLITIGFTAVVVYFNRDRLSGGLDTTLKAQRKLIAEQNTLIEDLSAVARDAVAEVRTLKAQAVSDPFEGMHLEDSPNNDATDPFKGVHP